MKTIKATQTTPQTGKVQIFLRIEGKIMYFKFNSNQYASQMMAQMKQRGADIQLSKHNTWIRIDIIKDNELVILDRNQNIEIDQKEMSPEEIETKLAEFYADRYRKAKFEVEVE